MSAKSAKSASSASSDSNKFINSFLCDNPEPSSDELDSFKNLVNDWFKYDDQIRKLNIALKERKNYQKALNTQIQEFMFKFKYNDLNTQFGRIKANESKIKEPIKMNDIKSIILNSNLSGQDLFDEIFAKERPSHTIRKISRIIPKVSLQI